MNDLKLFISPQQSSPQRIKQMKIKNNKRQQYIFKLISLRNSTFLEDEFLDKSAQTTIEYNDNVRSDIHSLIEQIHNYKHSNNAFFISQQHHSQQQKHKQHKTRNKHHHNHHNYTIIRKSTLNHVTNTKPYHTVQNNYNNNNNRYNDISMKQYQQQQSISIINHNSSRKSLRKISKKQQSYNNSTSSNGSGNIVQKLRFLQSEKQIPLVRRETINTNRYEYKRKSKQYFHIQLNKDNITLSSRQNNNQHIQILPQIKVNGKYTTIAR